MIRKVFAVVLKFVLDQLSGRIKVAKTAFLVGAVAGVCVGSLVTFLVCRIVS